MIRNFFKISLLATTLAFLTFLFILYNANQDLISFVNQLPLYILIYLILILINYGLSLYFTKVLRKFLDKTTKTIGDEKLEKTSENFQKDFNHLTNLTSNLNKKVKELSIERQKLERIISEMNQGIILIDATYRVKLINDNAKKILNLSNKVLTKNLLENISDIKLVALIREFSYSDNESEHFTLDDYNNSGFVFDLRLSKINAKWIDDIAKYGFLIVITDISENYKTNKIKTTFIQNASHELKTPITAIRGYLELITEGLVDETTKDELLIKIHQKTIKMNDLIDDILNLSKLEKANYKLNVRTFNLKDLVTSVFNDYQQKAKEMKVNLVNDLADDLIISSDLSIMTIVITNIISNGIKYNQENGTLKVYLEDNSLIIEDEGIGLEESEISRIFERFYRVNYDVRGTGLGLAIVKHSLNLLGKQVHVESKIGEGTKFIITL